MRTRALFLAVFVLAVSCISFAQGIPIPALRVPNANDFTVSAMGFVKDSSYNMGWGGDVSTSHYLTQHWGVKVQANALKSTEYALREFAVRGGPVYRFGHHFGSEPYVQTLFGYSKAKATYTGWGRPYNNGFSVLAGAGTDVHLTGPLYARVGLDYVHDSAGSTRHIGEAGSGVTQYVRGTLGFTYRFGPYRGY